MAPDKKVPNRKDRNQIKFYLSDEDNEGLKRLCELADASQSEILRSLIRLANLDPKILVRAMMLRAR